MNDVVTVLLAGGKGTRLDPLTRDRAKPAVPFGGIYRIIDFTLSNCLNSGLRQIFVLTQYKASSLDRHIAMGWGMLSRELGEYIEILPPQQRIDQHWYKGTGDAIYQNIYSIERANPQLVLILAGDHIYKMDYMEMIRFHRERQADLTVGCIPVPLDQCMNFGVMEIDKDERITNFIEKPPQTSAVSEHPGHFLASMGIYIFNSRLMYEVLVQDATRNESRHDFGILDGDPVSVILNEATVLPSDQLKDHTMTALLSQIERFMEIDAQPGSPWTDTRALFDKDDGHLLWFKRSVKWQRERVEIEVRLFKPLAAGTDKTSS
jgi:glucose-1-phosphate adenylyltransferase